ncbi:MAG: hypothetical protein RH948_16035 [Cyclobacteriaceae bacterium]
MPHLLQNENLSVNIDLPLENYQQTRYDWSGKITKIIYRDKVITTQENEDSAVDTIGRGLYNEFGFKQPLGYDEIKPSDWYHKIGVGLLKKDDKPYDFLKTYEVIPANFKVTKETSQLIITCQSAVANGYAYELVKKINLLSSGLEISYQLTNTGEKTIHSNEYIHNFLAVEPSEIAKGCTLKFPFDIKPNQFDEHIDTENLLLIGDQDISVKNSPKAPYFLSDLSGGAPIDARWQFENSVAGIGISESCDFSSRWVALWGTGHVISPELYLDIHLLPADTQQWTRTFRFYDLD